MSSEDFERRINNQLAAIVENQARHDSEIGKILEAVAGMIQVARAHEERLDRIERQTEESSQQIGRLEKQVEETSDAVKQTTDNLNALIRIVDHHISNHP